MAKRRHRKKLTTQRRRRRVRWHADLIAAANELHESLCDIGAKHFPSDLARFLDRSVQTPYRQPKSQNPNEAVKRLVLAMVRSPASWAYRDGRVPDDEELDNSRLIYPTRASKRCTPELALEAITDEIAEKRDWLQSRRPQLHLVSLDHEHIPAGEGEKPRYVWESLDRLKRRCRVATAIIARNYALGGVMSADIAPIRMNGKRWVKVHLHMLVEPYEPEIPLVENTGVDRVIEKWESTAEVGELDSCHFASVRSRKEDRENALMYVLGLTRLHEHRVPKILKGYFSGDTDVPMIPTNDERESGGDRVETPCKPTFSQLRLLLAFHSYPHLLFQRPFGGWSEKSWLGRIMAASPKEYINDARARTWLRNAASRPRPS